MSMRLVRVILFFMCVATSVLTRAFEVPDYNRQHKEVTDLSGTLKPEQVDALVSKIRSLKSSDGTQLAVLIIQSLEGDDIFEFSQRVVTKWDISQKPDNVALLIIAMKDHKSRIHVGYGLEGRLTDALSSRILRNELQPEFRAGRYYEGIDRTLDAIVKAVKGEYTAPAPKSTSGGGDEFGFWFILLFFVVIWIWSVFSSRRSRRRRGGLLGGYYPMGTFGSGGGWSSGSSGGDWGGSSSGGGWSSGGDSGFGGSSGGGSFGGGGASGDW
jgi:uncharacterized protein